MASLSSSIRSLLGSIGSVALIFENAEILLIRAPAGSIPAPLFQWSLFITALCFHYHLYRLSPCPVPTDPRQLCQQVTKPVEQYDRTSHKALIDRVEGGGNDTTDYEGEDYSIPPLPANPPRADDTNPGQEVHQYRYLEHNTEPEEESGNHRSIIIHCPNWFYVTTDVTWK